MSPKQSACPIQSANEAMLRKLGKIVGGVKNADQVWTGETLLRNPQAQDFHRVSKLCLYTIDCEMIELISHRLPCLLQLSVYHKTHIGDRQCMDIGKNLRGLRRLYLNCQPISDSTLIKILKNLNRLEYLKMVGTLVTPKTQRQVRLSFKLKDGLFL